MKKKKHKKNPIPQPTIPSFQLEYIKQVHGTNPGIGNELYKLNVMGIIEKKAPPYES